ncbi:Aste57867_11279 [Aphanomyces stellatus]|uniref:Aste57867_11279 protein n=1 Tax=Aphanomyces stellatus TaxID=120398 RepID=A0A485KT06_9STRA|nr:hypothetical protein As57867_011237 [Aphanomyces stellatus]VFT88141.1 Aste57867_11279 [Aphanomyces stellatus]
MTSKRLGPIALAMRAQAKTSRKGCKATKSKATCYMCMESTYGSVDTPLELIAPCVCRSYVHRKCLDHWRVTSNTSQAMTRCPTCRQDYTFDVVQVPNDEKLKNAISSEQCWRWFLVLGVTWLGSMVIWLIDRGTPAFLHWHWNGLDGKIYTGFGFTETPRFEVYFLISFLAAAFITGVHTTVSWCIESCRNVCTESCNDTNGSCTESCNDTDGSCTDCDSCECGDCDCCGGCSSSSDCGCLGGDGDSNDCGGELAGIVIVVVIVCMIFVGFVVMLSAVVGGIGSVIDQRGDKRIRRLQVQRERICNLRPIENVV